MRPASTTGEGSDVRPVPPAATQAARESFLVNDAEVDQTDLRTEIVASWRRSRRMGVAPDGVHVPYVDAGTTPHQLLRAALPVIEQLATHLDDSTAGLPPKPWRVADSCWSLAFVGTLMPSGLAKGVSGELRGRFHAAWAFSAASTAR